MVTSVGSCLLDTNVLVYALDESSVKHEAVREKMRQLLDQGWRLCITEQVIREWLVVVTNPNVLSQPLSPKEAKALAGEIMVAYSLLPSNGYSRVLLLDLIERYRLRGAKIHDANLVAVMRSYDVHMLWTYNRKDFKVFSEVTLL